MSKAFYIFIIVAALLVIAAVAWFANRPVQPETTTIVPTTTTTTATGDIELTTNVVNNNDTTAVTTTPVSTAAFTLLQPATKTEQGDITNYSFSSDTTVDATATTATTSSAPNAVSIMPADMQSLTLAETPVQSREPITVSGVSGERLTVSSAKDGSSVTIVQIVRDDVLYDFRGDADFLNHLSDYIQFN